MKSALLVVPLILIGGAAWGQTFAPPVAITDDSTNHQLARNSGSVLAMDSNGVLHLTYWRGGFSTSPASPSDILYRSWDEATGWSSETVIDQSFSGPDRVGGRHPTLSVGPDDDIWVVWQDNRHGTPAGNWIDNSEIYGIRKPASGVFPSTDIRLTETNAMNNGDSGFLPVVAHLSDGSAVVVWYDFWDDGFVSDVYARFSDATGLFNPTETIADHRLTNRADRGGSPAYSVPDIVVDSTNTVHAIWTSGFGGPAPIYYASVPNPPALTTESIIAQNSTSFFEPAKINVGIDDTLYVVYTRLLSGERDILMVKKAPSDSTFGAPIPLRAEVGTAERNADFAVGSDGRIHLVYLQGTGSATTTRYARFAPITFMVELDEAITLSTGSFERPSITLGIGERPFVVYEENISASSGRIWFAQPANATVRDWMILQ